MAWITRRDPASAPRDPKLTNLSVGEAEQVRQLARRAFGEHGLEVTLHPDHLVDSEGREFALWNVASHCATQPRTRWQAVISEHVTAVLDAFTAPNPFTHLSAEVLAASVYCRLQEVTPASTWEEFHHREFVPGVLELLALDLPAAVRTIPKEQADRFGGWEHLRQLGLANLRSLPMGQVVNIPAGSADVRLLTDESIHTGSRSLVVDHLMREVGDEPSELGWLLAVPNWHQVAWHAITGATVTDALASLSVVAERCHAASPGTISREVFWWSGEGYEQLTSHTSGRREFTWPPRFIELLARLR